MDRIKILKLLYALSRDLTKEEACRYVNVSKKIFKEYPEIFVDFYRHMNKYDLKFNLINYEYREKKEMKT